MAALSRRLHWVFFLAFFAFTIWHLPQKTVDNGICLLHLRKTGGQRYKAVKGILHADHLYHIAGFFQLFSVCFPFIPQGIIFRCHNKRAGLTGKVGGHQWCEIWIYLVGRTALIKLQKSVDPFGGQKIIGPVLMYGRKGG